LLQQFLQFRPLGFFAAYLFFENAFAAFFLEGVFLERQILVFGADAGLADLHKSFIYRCDAIYRTLINETGFWDFVLLFIGRSRVGE